MRGRVAGRSFVCAAVVLCVTARTGAARGFLTQADVERIVGQTYAAAKRLGLPVAIAVVDKEGAPLAAFQMDGARDTTTLLGGGRAGEGFEGVTLPPSIRVNLDAGQVTLSGAMLAALSKAGTGALFATQGNAFTPRTAGFIIQPHFPPGVARTSSGPLFGVQFSSLFACGDVNPVLPLGLAADPGGFPLYKDGRAAGGLGVEGNGRYTFDPDPGDDGTTREERIAMAGSRGFRAPPAIRGDQILVGGLRFPFANVDDEDGPPAAPFATLEADPAFSTVGPAVVTTSRFVPGRLGGVRGEYDPRFFPPTDSVEPAAGAGGLTSAEVLRLLAQGARRANRLRAAIRRPIGDRARVTIAIVDRGGNVLGLFRTRDAPVFGFDVAVQKARTAAYFSRSDAGASLRARVFPGGGDVPLDAYVAAAAGDGIRLGGQVAFSTRAVGFLSRPFFPDDIDGTRHGPFSRPTGVWSPFNDGLQTDLVVPALVKFLSDGATPAGASRLGSCTGVAGLANGIQIFPGSVPLYRDGTLVGAAGVSGDGVDQDDTVAVAASRGFTAPKGMRADRVRVRGVRLPYVKFPRRADVR